MDSAHQAFYKNEERLHALSAPPSDIVRRQVRVTPYPHEDAGWIIRNAARRGRCACSPPISRTWRAGAIR